MADDVVGGDGSVTGFSIVGGVLEVQLVMELGLGLGVSPSWWWWWWYYRLGEFVESGNGICEEGDNWEKEVEFNGRDRGSLCRIMGPPGGPVGAHVTMSESPECRTHRTVRSDPFLETRDITISALP